MKFVNSRGGGSWSDFRLSLLSFSFLSFFFFGFVFSFFLFGGAPLDTWGPLWMPGGPKLQLT